MILLRVENDRYVDEGFARRFTDSYLIKHFCLLIVLVKALIVELAFVHGFPSLEWNAEYLVTTGAHFRSGLYIQSRSSKNDSK